MNYKISELQNRYGLKSRQSVYDRMKSLRIRPVGRGIISSEQLDKLDKLNEFIQNNPKAPMWELSRETEVLSSGQLDKPSGQLNNFNEMLQLVDAIARHFSSQDPIAKYKALEYAAKKQLILLTSKIKELMGAKPNSNFFCRGSFAAKAAGRIGRERAWRVHNING